MTDTFLLESDLRAHSAKVTAMRVNGATEDDVAAYLTGIGWDDMLEQWRAAR